MKRNHTRKRAMSFALSAIMTLGLAFNGQATKSVLAEETNVVSNGNLELWSGDKPDGWAGKWENAEKGSIAHSGKNSIKQKSDSDTKDISYLVKGIIPGQEYTISFWYYDADDSARCRNWIAWKDGSKYLNEHRETLKLEKSYLPQKNAWVEWKTTLTAPADADSLNFELRAYKDSNGEYGGYIYFDDLYVGTEGEIGEDNKVAQVESSVKPGKVLKGTAIELSTVTTDSTIYYTFGEEALTTTDSAIKYTTPIEINEDTTIHALAVKDGLENSDESVFSYEVLEESDFTKIYDIQGEGHVSPIKDETVYTVGVVTGVATDKYDAGIYIQDVEGDGKVGTSDGIFVRGKGIKAVIGDKVLVKGQVIETLKYPATASDDEGHLSITEIKNYQTTVLKSDMALPTPIILGEGGRALITDNVDDDKFTEYNPEQDAIDFYESLEGMLVKINNPRIVGVQEKYGTFDVLADNGAASEGKLNPRGGIKITKENINPEILHIDDVVTPVSNGDKEFMDHRFDLAKVGDSFADSIIGVMDYNFGAYKIYNTSALPNLVLGVNERETTDIVFDEEKLTVAVYNIENFSADKEQTPDEKVEKIAKSIISELGSPDILSLVEVQDNDGPDKEGDSNADKSYERLIKSIEENGGPEYRYTDIAPVPGMDGGQPGGNIRVGFIYQPDRVEFFGTKGGQLEAAEMNGKHLAKNPSRVEPENEYFERTRKSLVGEFMFRGESVFVISNHFSSKRGDGPDFGYVQPPVKGSEPDRHEQARAVNNFIKEIIEEVPDANIVVLGDMNDYEYSETLDILKGEEMINMIDTLPLLERYSYVHSGNLQVLDNMLVTKGIKDDAVVDVVHVNAEFTEGSGRASDHDPVVVQLSNIEDENYIRGAKFSEKSGFVKKGTEISITNYEKDQTNTEVLYTIGKSEETTPDPRVEGVKYTEAIALDTIGNTVIKAVVKKGEEFSVVTSVSYDVDFAEISVYPGEKEVLAGTVVTAKADEEIYYSITGEKDVTKFKAFPEEGITLSETTTLALVVKVGDEFGQIREFTYTVKNSYTIAAARASALGRKVKVQGIVTSKIGNNIFMQDDTAGIYVYVGGSKKEEFVVGNKIEVAGSMAEFNGLMQISKVGEVNLISENNILPEPMILEPSQLDESKESILVKIEDMKISKVGTDSGKGYTIEATKNGEKVSLRVDKYVKSVDSSKFKVGMTIDAVAAVAEYNGNYQLMLSGQDDIIINPVVIESFETAVSKFDENGNQVFEKTTEFKNGQVVSLNAQLSSLEARNASVIVKIVDSNNFVYMMNYLEKDFEADNKAVSVRVNSGLFSTKKGEYKAQILVWENMNSQKVLSKVKEITFTVK